MIVTDNNGIKKIKMSYAKKTFVLYQAKKSTPKDISGRLIIAHAPEITFSKSAELWQEKNKEIDRQTDRSNCQIIILTPYRDDVTHTFYRSLKRSLLGKYPVATTVEQEFPDGELKVLIEDEATSTNSVYIVASILNERDFCRVRRVADHYRRTLNSRLITLICPFLGATRQDKNIDNKENYEPTTINIRAELAAFSSLIDRIIVVEPHSSATQTYAAQFGIPLLPLSPWKLMIDNLVQTGVLLKNSIPEERVRITPQNSVIIRPDKGRNLAAKRIGKYLKIPSVSFEKKRLSGQSISIFELTPQEQILVEGKIAIMYDDEASTMGTIAAIADALQKYKTVALAVCLVHCKFTSGWESKIKHPLLTTVLGTDSRQPIGNINIVDNIRLVSLEPLLRQVIAADIKGINFWNDPDFKEMILQE